MELKVGPACRWQQRGQRMALDRRVGHDEGKHGRHIGGDHARALGDAVERHRNVANERALGGELGERVRGHDRARGLRPAVPCRLRRHFCHHAPKFGCLQRLADHPRRGDEHLLRRAARRVRRVLCRRLHGIAPAPAGEGIGVAGVHDKRPGLAMLELRAAPIDRRGCRLGARQHAACLRAFREERQQHVGAARIFDPGLGDGQPHARNRRQFR